MKTLFRCLPLALVAFAVHAQAQSVSPAYDSFRGKEAAPPATAEAAAPQAQPAGPQAAPTAPVQSYAAPEPYAAPTPVREKDDGGFFIGVQGGRGWIYEDVDQDAVAVNAGYRWQAGPWAQVGVEVARGRLDSATEYGYLVPKVTYGMVGANARFNFGNSPWFATVRSGYFSAEQDSSFGGDFSTDGGYGGVAIGVDVTRHFNINLGYTAFVYADDYYHEDGCDIYDDCYFNRADTVMLGLEARF